MTAHNFKSNFLTTLQQRGFIQDCTDFEGLDNYFSTCEKNKKPAVAYIGFDCTAASLHAGSLMQIMILRWLQKCGHKPITLLGGGTTKIGDPSGKDESRKMLSDRDIKNNMKGIRKVFDKFLKNYDLVDNDKWLSKLNFLSYLQQVGRLFSVNRMITMETAKRRLEGGNELSLLEFNYMIFQAYDFIELNKRYGCRLQIGGSDQWGNITCGTDLFQKMKPENHRKNFIEEKKKEYSALWKSDEKEFHKKVKEEYSLLYDIFGLTTPLLTTSSGAKMGKTADGAIWLDAELLKPNDYWQYWRNTEDKDVGRFLKLFTELSLEDIERVMAGNINEAKKVLANEVTKLLHGEAAAKAAEETARKVFEQGGVGDDLPELKLEKGIIKTGIPIAQLFKDAGLVESNGEAKKLIQGGGVRINDEKISDIGLIVNSSHLKEGIIKLSAGKKKHALIKVK